MRPERNISLVFGAIAIALVLPTVLAMTRDPLASPGPGFLVGGALAALGVFLGSLVVAGHPSSSARMLGQALWILVALAFTGAFMFGAMHSPTWPGRSLLGLVGILPLVGAVVVLFKADRG